MIRDSIGFHAVNDAVGKSMAKWVGQAVQAHFGQLFEAKASGSLSTCQTGDEEQRAKLDMMNVGDLLKLACSLRITDKDLATTLSTWGLKAAIIADILKMQRQARAAKRRSSLPVSHVD